MADALIGGITATVLWEIARHVLVWYFGTLSQVSVVYGTLTTSIVVLLSLEIGCNLAVARCPGHRGVRAHRHENQGCGASLHDSPPMNEDAK